MTDKSETVIVIHETVWKSYARDLGTFAMLFALVGTGRYIDSTALQWLGAIMGFCAIVGRANAHIAARRMTIPQARIKLDELEAGL